MGTLARPFPIVFFSVLVLLVLFIIKTKWVYPLRGISQFSILIISEIFFFCNQGIPCANCPLSFGICPVGTTQRLAFIKDFPVALTFGFIAMTGLILGTLTCGWACPLGFIQDLFSKGPYPKFQIPQKLARGRYLGLAGLTLLIFLELRYQFFSQQGYQILNPWTIYGGMFLLSLGLFFHRPFCKTLCPFSLLYGTLNKFSRFKVHLTCSNCGRCAPFCITQIEPRSAVNKDLCMKCHNCRITCQRNKPT